MTDKITVRGFVATKPELRQMPDNTHVTSFRVASNSRRFDSEKGEWVDVGSTNWYTVNCYRFTAVNTVASINVGDPVLVLGRLKQREWFDTHGQKRMSVEIEAASLGPDLALGSAQYKRTGAQRSAGPGESDSGHGTHGGGDTAHGEVAQGASLGVMSASAHHPAQHGPTHDPVTGEILERDEGPLIGGPTLPSPMTGGVGLQAGDVDTSPAQAVDLNAESEWEGPASGLVSTGV